VRFGLASSGGHNPPVWELTRARKLHVFPESAGLTTLSVQGITAKDLATKPAQIRCCSVSKQSQMWPISNGFKDAS
jgi:hypothetical protein